MWHPQGRVGRNHGREAGYEDQPAVLTVSAALGLFRGTVRGLGRGAGGGARREEGARSGKLLRCRAIRPLLAWAVFGEVEEGALPRGDG